MPLSITHLRRWFAAAAIALVLLVAGVYFHAKLRVQNALKQVPEKIGVEIQQSATGFTISKSEQGRTWFKIEASKAVQFKQGGKAQLHDVTVTIYGRDSSRYDRISGADFNYDPQAGEISAKGEVQIDLEANPEGTTNPDQDAPRGLKSPIHLKTSGLVFNQKTGDASTKERVEFSLPQASGSAVGIRYLAATGELRLESEVNILTGATGVALTAVRAAITKTAHQVWLDHPLMTTATRRCQSDQATVFLRPDNRVSRILATGNILVQGDADPAAKARGDQLELLMGEKREGLRAAILSGNVTADVAGAQPTQASAGRVVLDFGARNQVTKVHTEENVKLAQHQASADASHPSQDLDLTASAVDFLLTRRGRLDRVETSGAAQIAIRPAGPGDEQQTLVTAGKFEAQFDDSGQLSTVHGAPGARIVSKNPGQPDRVSTSRSLDAAFRPGHGIESLVQQGSVVYQDGDRKAWGDLGRYTPADQVLLLSGSPRVSEGGMTTSAQTMRLNRATGTAVAEGEVKTTYSDLTPQPNGALLASSSPIHVTAHSMTAHSSAATALYQGGVRLWQDANVVEAPEIDFDRTARSLVAQGTPAQPVSTVLVKGDARGNSAVAVTCSRLTYADDERKVHFEGKVVAREADIIITARQMDAFLEARGHASADRSTTAGKLERIVASGGVVASEPQRRAEGNQLVYTAADDKFLLTGDSPSIFDAERGKITGVSLTFFRHDDRVLVEGDSSSPAVTQTRVAR
ncbi:MAG: LPS export ABC transporter periplasmic protein LptC [Terriglobales bacterium]